MLMDNILMTHWISVCLLSFEGMRRTLIAVLSIFFSVIVVEMPCAERLSVYFLKTPRSVNTGRELPFYSQCRGLQSLQKFRFFPTGKELRSMCMYETKPAPSHCFTCQFKWKAACHVAAHGRQNSCSFNYLPCHRNLIWPQRSHYFFLLLPQFPVCTVGMLNVFLSRGDTHPILQWLEGGSEYPEEEENMQRGGEKRLEEKNTVMSWWRNPDLPEGT